MIKMRSHPKEWDELIEEMRAHHNLNAIIAGGVVRDYLCGRPPKDIDVWVTPVMGDPYSGVPNYYPSKAKKAARLIGKQQYINCRNGDGFVHAVWEIKRKRSFLDLIKFKKPKLPLNIMDCEPCTPIELISTFDFGLCQAAWDGKELIYTEAFYKDFINQTFTLFPTRDKAKSTERYERFAKRYHNWPLVKSGGILREEMIDRYTPKPDKKYLMASYF